VEALLGEDTTEHVSHVRVRSRVRGDDLDALEAHALGVRAVGRARREVDDLGHGALQ
jgi:hypothetical protein